MSGTATFEDVRNRQASMIASIAPSTHSGVPFLLHRGEMPFASWIEANPQACFRRFGIYHGFDVALSGLSDGYVYQFEHSEEVIVAYPTEWAKYGPMNDMSLDVVIDKDFVAIDRAIGASGSASFVDGQNDCRLVSQSVTKSSGAWLLRLTYSVTYDRSYL